MSYFKVPQTFKDCSGILFMKKINFFEISDISLYTRHLPLHYSGVLHFFFYCLIQSVFLFSMASVYDEEANCWAGIEVSDNVPRKALGVVNKSRREHTVLKQFSVQSCLFFETQLTLLQSKLQKMQ